jgi:hypothetical protein
MNGQRFRWIASFGVVLIAVLLFAVSAGARTGYGDPAGDGRGGPDIRSLVIGDTGGVLTFTFKVVNLKVSPDTGVDDATVAAYLDTNRDGREDYMFYFGRDTEGGYWNLVSDRTGKPVPLTPTMRYVASGSVYKLQLSSTDLGGTTGFDIDTQSMTFDSAHHRTDVDRAPDDGLWSYDLTSVKPEIGAPTTSIAPAAGKALTITMPVVRSDTGAKLVAGATMTIDPMIGTTLVPHKELLSGGTASVHLTVPKTAKGKQLKVKVTVKLGTQTTTKTTTLLIA